MLSPQLPFVIRLQRWLMPVICLAALSVTARGEVRIKDITDVEGVRINQLEGMGLVVGLSGTGSKSPITRQYAINMMQRFGMRVEPSLRERLAMDTMQKTDNLSVVSVKANLPSFARKGSRLDVIVGTFDDATSLQGGQLTMTPLFAADGRVYAVASGPVSTGGFSFSGDAASVQKNFPTAGRIPEGATVEEETCTPLGLNGQIRLLLRSPDFETARRIATAINQEEPGMAIVLDAATVNVMVPPEYQDRVSAFLGMIGSLHIIPDLPARVVINERTGTVIIGENVRISSCLITHANLIVTTAENQQVYQANPFTDADPVTVDRTQIDVQEEKSQVKEVPATVTIGDLAQALNSLGVTPRDLSSILQQLKESGALHASLEFK